MNLLIQILDNYKGVVFFDDFLTTCCRNWNKENASEVVQTSLTKALESAKFRFEKMIMHMQYIHLNVGEKSAEQLLKKVFRELIYNTGKMVYNFI